MSANEARMCRKLFHFSDIVATLESDHTHAGIATESRDSDRILPRQSLGLSRSVSRHTDSCGRHVNALMQYGWNLGGILG
jgi:hypothetical protein